MHVAQSVVGFGADGTQGSRGLGQDPTAGLRFRVICLSECILGSSQVYGRNA
jgi:hypothetical protein